MKALMVIPLVVLSGCAQMQLQQAKEAASSRNAVCEAAGQDPRLDAIRAQIPVDARKATLEQLNDDRLATPEQKPAISSIQEVFARCEDLTNQYFAQYGAQGSNVVYQQYTQDTKLLESGLWAGKINFGQFNTARLKLDEQARVSISALERHAADQARAEQMQRSQNAAILAPYFLQASQPRPTYNTNCTSFGNSVNCTTR
jgi:hypothetical protein